MPKIRVEVVHALPGRADAVVVTLEEGATVQDALEAARLPAVESVGVFGRKTSRNRILRDGDRVELYRPLALDPMEARRRRARRR